MIFRIAYPRCDGFALASISHFTLHFYTLPLHTNHRSHPSATALADHLNLDFALINRKRRRDLTASFYGAFIPTVPPTPNGSDSGSSHEDEEAVEKMELLVGDVKGRVAVLVDDMIDTGHTVRLAAQVLRDAGAKDVYALISHGEFGAFGTFDRSVVCSVAGVIDSTLYVSGANTQDS